MDVIQALYWYRARPAWAGGLALTGQNLGGPQQTEVPGCTSNHAFISDEKLFFLFMLVGEILFIFIWNYLRLSVYDWFRKDCQTQQCYSNNNWLPRRIFLTCHRFKQDKDRKLVLPWRYSLDLIFMATIVFNKKKYLRLQNTECELYEWTSTP